MDNNDNCEFVYNIERKIREDEEEFIYTLIEPFCETVVEKKLSKAELKQILEKGMQKSIPLEKVKQAREEIRKLDDINPDYPMDRTIHVSRNEVLEIIDKLITESEVNNG